MEEHRQLTVTQAGGRWVSPVRSRELESLGDRVHRGQPLELSRAEKGRECVYWGGWGWEEAMVWVNEKRPAQQAAGRVFSSKVFGGI